ncbi:ferritin-like domain-containing protein [Chryseobacterium foetidum]|uniref:ferritin-like domain-containing protein n=1 Tax=Chryseobacterium foetidum TaxID=2951057 RepID=UPI0021C90954|nr:PA2169 family four-helix-bundle protein [Chryseobacterium foetidum]
MTNKETVSVLNDLLNITMDRIKGFNKVEEKVWDTHSYLKNDYEEMVAESEQMKNDLITCITEHGGEYDDSPTVSGTVHRAWIDVKNAFTPNNAESTLENVVFGEKSAIAAYQEALQSDQLSPESILLVQDQHQKLQNSFAKFQSLEN